MKVIKSKSSEWPKHCTCEECKAELEYDREDTFVGWMGYEYVTCPVCDNQVTVSEQRVQNPVYPYTFRHTNSETAVAVSDERIQDMVDNVVEAMEHGGENYKGEFITYSQGDTLVIGYKCEDGYNLYVTKNYWEDMVDNE